jgi:hypothetical protein
MRVKTGGAAVAESLVRLVLLPPFLHLVAQDLFGIGAFLFGA